MSQVAPSLSVTRVHSGSSSLTGIVMLKKLYIRCFYPRDSEQPCLELGPFDLPAQEKKRTSLYLNEPVEISGPAGDWLIEVQVEDEKNNLSNIYRLHVIINQW